MNNLNIESSTVAKIRNPSVTFLKVGIELGRMLKCQIKMSVFVRIKYFWNICSLLKCAYFNSFFFFLHFILFAGFGSRGATRFRRHLVTSRKLSLNCQKMEGNISKWHTTVKKGTQMGSLRIEFDFFFEIFWIFRSAKCPHESCRTKVPCPTFKTRQNIEKCWELTTYNFYIRHRKV